MKIIKAYGFSFFFGQAQDFPIEHADPTFYTSCKKTMDTLKCSTLVVQEQTHSTMGMYIDKDQSQQNPLQLKETTGDYLITNQKGVALGVLTADCLPIVMIETRNHIGSIIHAGWKGSVAGITTKTIEHMLQKHFFAPTDLHVYFGPCAKSCCYEVQPDFLHALAEYPWHERVIEQRNEKLFFNLPLFNKLHLVDLGIDPSHIHMQYNECTICNTAYHSNRRNGHARLCQLSVICR